MKVVKVVLSERAAGVYQKLKAGRARSKSERAVLRGLEKKVELIKADPHHGNPISKKLIPVAYVRTLGVRILFRVELPDRWRLLYTLTAGDRTCEIIAFILDICDHRTYDKLFGYRKK